MRTDDASYDTLGMAIIPLALHASRGGLAEVVLTSLVVGLLAIREIAREPSPHERREAVVLRVTTLVAAVSVGAIGAVIVP
jgi:hypothetical protein